MSFHSDTKTSSFKLLNDPVELLFRQVLHLLHALIVRHFENTLAFLFNSR